MPWAGTSTRLQCVLDTKSGLPSGEDGKRGKNFYNLSTDMHRYKQGGPKLLHSFLKRNLVLVFTNYVAEYETD